MDFLQNLQDVFSREPPMVSKYEQLARPPPGQTNGEPPPVPPVPPKPGRSVIETQTSTPPRVVAQDRPPPPPPKPFEGRGRPPSSQLNSGLPLPPLPPQPEWQVRRDGRFQEHPPNNYLSNFHDQQRMGQSIPQQLGGLRHGHLPSDQTNW